MTPVTDGGASARSLGRVVRSPADVLRLAVAVTAVVALLVVEGLFGDTLVGFASDLLRGLDAVPQWIVDVVVVATRVLAIVVVGGGLLSLVWHARWRMLATVAAAGALALVLDAMLQPMTEASGRPPSVDMSSGLGPLGADTFPTLAGIAAVSGVLTGAAPWLNRRSRRLGWALVVGMVVTRSLTSPASFGSLIAVLAGWLAGAAVLVALGAPSRHPTTDSVAAGLAAVGLPIRELEPAGVDARGSTPYFGTAADGTRLFVKALGDDERSADLLFRFYRRLQPRDYGDERPFSSLRRGVEHEALVALAARSLGIRTPPLRAFATAAPNGYVLAYEAIEGRSLDRVDARVVTDDVLGSIWRLVLELREHRIAHRDLRLANLFLDDEEGVWLIDFGFSEMAASDLLLATDVAELVASSSLYVGAERAVREAAAVIDPAGLRAANARLHLWALSGATRTGHKARPGLLDELRRRLAAVAVDTAPAG